MTTLFAIGNLIEAAPTVLYWIGKALLLGSCAALLTWFVVSTLLRAARPTLITAFWVVVLLRFIVPDVPGLPISLSGIINFVAPISQSAPHAPAAPEIGKRSDGGDEFYFVVDSNQSAAKASVNSAAAPVVKRSSGVWAAGFTILYVVAVIALIVIRIRSYLRFAARCRSLPEADDAVVSVVREICRLSGVSREPRVHIHSSGNNAFVFGLFQPTLVISREHLKSREELRAIVLHEVAHLRRGDLLVRYVQWFVGTLLFFWPVVAWVNRRIDLAREHACDEWALRHGALSATQYARCLLRAARGGQMPSNASYTPAAMASNSNHVERRIEMIFQSSSRMRASRWLGVTSGVALLAWGGFVLSGASAMVAAKANVKARTLGGHPVSSVNDDVQTGTCEKRVMVCTVSSDASSSGTWVTDGGQVINCDTKTGVIVANSDTSPDGTETRKCVVKVCQAVDPAALEEFRATHPTADANGDGTLTPAEHNAFLAALALRDGAAVIAQFPKADLNGDGVLDSDEAVRLATLGLPFEMKCNVAFAGDPGAVQVSTTTENNSETGKRLCFVTRTATASTDGEAGALINLGVCPESGENGQLRVIAHCITSDDAGANGEAVELNVNGEKIVVPAAGDDEETVTEDGNRKIIVRRVVRHGDEAGADAPADVLKQIDLALPQLNWVSGSPVEGPMLFGGPRPVATWLIDNINATPTEEEVAGLVARVESLPFDMFLKDHPDADSNQDGALTPEERDAFLQTLIGNADVTINGESAGKLGCDAKVMVMTTDGEGLEQHSQELLKAFPEADTNGDGVLSQEELHAHIQSMMSSNGQVDPNNPHRRMLFIKRDGATVSGSTTDADGKREVEIRVESGSSSPKQ